MGKKLLLILLIIALALQVHAGTFSCAIRTSCNANETVFILMNSSEAGAAPNNSHAQLANYSGGTYPYSVCCWTDSFRTMTNSCGGNGLRILGLFDVTNTHVQQGNYTNYVYSACLNVTAGNISCTYADTSCPAGYNGVVSMASSEIGDMNQTNAHVADPGYYMRKVCCQIGAQNPPTIASVNISPTPNASTRNDLECQNGTTTDPDGDAVYLAYNWYRNGTSITLLNLPMDYDSNNGITHDISGFGNHGTVNGATFLPTGGEVGGAFNFSSSGTNITVAPSSSTNITTQDFSVSVWIYYTGITNKTIITTKKDTTANSAGFILYHSNKPIFIVGNGTAQFTATPFATPLSNGWNHIVAIKNSTQLTLYMNGGLYRTTGLSGIMNVNSPYSPVIGTSIGGDTGNYNSTLDELIIFNRSLSQSEVQTLFNLNNRFLNGTELMRNDRWNCSITPIDSTGLNGSTVFSNQTNISGSPPLAPTLIYPANNNQSVFERFVNFTWSTADERDGDQVNYTLNLTITPGVCSVQTTQSNIQSINYTYGELCVDQLYNWTVQACDIDGCSARSTQSNFTVQSVVGLQLTVNLSQLGTFDRNQTKATDADNLNPFIVNNTGNVRINITLNATNNPFSSIGIPSTNYQFKGGVNTSNAFNTSCSQTAYTPFDTQYKNLICQLNYSFLATNTTAKIDVNITAPIDEPPGNKQGNFTVKAVAS